MNRKDNKYERIEMVWDSLPPGGGNFVLGDTAVLSEDATTISLTDVDISSKIAAVIVLKLKSAGLGSNDISLFYNGDDVATNYYTQSFTANGGTGAFARANNAIIGSLLNNASDFRIVTIQNDNAGNTRAIVNQNYQVPANVSGQMFWHVWNSTEDVTSIQFTGSVQDGLDVDSTFTLFYLET